MNLSPLSCSLFFSSLFHFSRYWIVVIAEYHLRQSNYKCASPLGLKQKQEAIIASIPDRFLLFFFLFHGGRERRGKY